MSAQPLVLNEEISNAPDGPLAIGDAWQRCCQSFYRYFAVRLGDQHAADDLMQQLWLQSSQRDATRRDPDPEAWMWRIAQNLLRAHWRHSGQFERRLRSDPALACTLAREFDQGDA